MNRELLESVVESQIFNDTFEVPGLEFLAQLEPEQIKAMVGAAVVPFAMLTRKEDPDLNSVVTSMGNAAARALGVTCNTQNTVRLGSFMLTNMHLCGLLDIEEVEDGIRTKYLLKVDDFRAVAKLWKGCKISNEVMKPYRSPPPISIKRVLRRNNPRLFPELTPENCPMVFSLLHKSNNKAWVVDQDILGWAQELIHNNSVVFDDIWKSPRAKARVSKLRLVTSILELADEFKEGPFYHEYFLDFRGRVYPYTAFLNEQSIDIAKGLLRLHQAAPLGKDGLKWIKVGLATTWAGAYDGPGKTDKIPVAARVAWADSNIDLFLSYAEMPMEQAGWMKADAPWQFLSLCKELADVFAWVEDGNVEEDFESGVVVYIDGSNNGSQHLAAMTRDEVSAPHVNLVPSEFPGDLYKFVAEFVWQEIDGQVAAQAEPLDAVVEHMSALRASVRAAMADPDLKKEMVEAARNYRMEHKAEIAAAAPSFWQKITEPSEQRKVSKRGVMTITYGATPYGMGEQVIDDAPKHGIETLLDMERSWGAYMGHLIHKTAFKYMPRSTALLTVFETAGRRKGVVGKSLAWKVPKTNFPAIQDYTRGPVVTVTCSFSDTTLKISTYSKEVKVEQPSKQKSGAAPNIVHSLDAAHLTMVVATARFPVVTVHDSFGSAPGDMEDLFHLVRQQFVELYKDNPLPDLLVQLGVGDLEVSYGSLDINDVLKSEFCFI